MRNPEADTVATQSMESTRQTSEIVDTALIALRALRVVARKASGAFERDKSEGVKRNPEIQKIFDSTLDNGLYGKSWALRDFNAERNLDDCYLASGMSGYFSEQIDKGGFSHLALKEQDKEDAAFISGAFGRDISFGDNDLQVLYATLLGTTEMNYATQLFPAGIMEGVFQCDASHQMPIRPKVGEGEVDYCCRIMEHAILEKSDFPQGRKTEVLVRARRLSESFLKNKNRIYVVPTGAVKNNKASFGDVVGLRDGGISGEDLVLALSERQSLAELFEGCHIENSADAYDDLNLTSEFGVAIYGEIPMRDVSFIEVPRVYELMQRTAREQGLDNGEEIGDSIERTVLYGKF